MKITKEQLLKVADDKKVICWSDMLVNLELLPLFKKYKEEKHETYSIKKIRVGKTLLKEIDAKLKDRIVKSKDKRVKGYRDNWKLVQFSWDALNSMPEEAKEDIDYMELEDL